MGYSGLAGACTCDNGYYGSVSKGATNNTLSGCVACIGNTWAVAGNGKTCTAVTCNGAPQYTGTSGACTCAAGHEGTVTYTAGVLGGCVACIGNTWAVAGNGKTCTAVSCFSAGYTGNPGACTCAAGYVGTVNYTNGVLGGCTAVLCSSAGYT